MYLCNHFQYKFIVFSFKFVTLFQHSEDMSRSRSWNSKTVALKARGEMCSSEEMSEFSFPLITTEDVSLKVKLFEDAILKANCMFVCCGVVVSMLDCQSKGPGVKSWAVQKS